MKKTILAIAFLTAIIVACKKSSTTTSFSNVIGIWNGTIGTNNVPLYFQILNDNTLAVYQHDNPDPNSHVTIYFGKWNFDAANRTFRDTTSAGGPTYFDSLYVSSDFKTMTGSEKDTARNLTLPFNNLTHTSK